jgi:hypothetical protein
MYNSLDRDAMPMMALQFCEAFGALQIQARPTPWKTPPLKEKPQELP